MKRSVIVVIALFAAAPLSAVTFSVVSHGTAVPNAEVCWWKAGGSTNPVARFFVPGGVTCAAAGVNAVLPPGDVNVFARAAGMVSDETILLTASNRPKEVTMNVVPAVAVDVRGLSLGEGEHAFAYLPRTSSAIPLEGNALVPADSLVVPVIGAGKGIVRIGAEMTTKGGKTALLESATRKAGHFDAVVPLRFASVPKGKGGTPAVTATDAAGRAHTSRTPLVPKADAAAIAFIRDIPVGATTITLDGERWKSASWKIDADAQRTLAVVEPPLVANATSRFSVHWWTAVDFTSYKLRNDEKCAKSDWQAPPEPGKSFAAILLRCPDQRRGLGIGGVDRSSCAAVAEKPLPFDKRDGVVQFDDVAAGLYFVKFTVPGLPPIFKSVEVTTDETSSADAELRYASFFGKVTRGGKPVHARLFGTTTDPETGRYDAIVTGKLAASNIEVVECSDAWRYMAVSDAAPAENAAFDIDVPENRIVVHVTDAATGTPIEKARVRLAALMPDDNRAAHFAGAGGDADANGDYVIAPVLKNRRLSICASDANHDDKCAELFTMGDTTEKTISLALDRIVKREGQITGVGPVKFGLLMWFSRAGQTTEFLRFSDPEGKFTYRRPHAEGEIAVFTARDNVLYAFVQPRIEEGSPFIINVPPARRRTFSVTLSQSSREEFAFTALLIGDLIVPENGVAQHLILRGVQPSLRPGWTATIPDVVETGPISVILLPESAVRGYAAGQGMSVELPLVPEWRSFPRKALGDGDAIVFE